MSISFKKGERCSLLRSDFQILLDTLARRDYHVLGPRIQDGAIKIDSLSKTTDLPEGWRDKQTPGSYRLEQTDDPSLFGFTVGPQSWKRFLFPPEIVLWRAQKTKKGFHRADLSNDARPFAFIGVRPCELAAIHIQDRVFLGGTYREPVYRDRRAAAFIVSVNCLSPADTCFCDSMGTGPEAKDGYDLGLTEIVKPGVHRFVVDIGSDLGAEIINECHPKPLTEKDDTLSRKKIEQSRSRMGRTMPTEGLKDRLQHDGRHPRWNETADRCLSCGNCTMVCPTCFCTAVEDETDLVGSEASRIRRWDSCFNIDYSYMHGGAVRTSVRARYRHWLSHKLANWYDQFGTPGCVGCGRCITWCPVGIDITEEAKALLETPEKTSSRSSNQK